MATSKAAGKLDKQAWHIIGMLILSIRFVQGWIYWGGGSRRFIFAPDKLEPSSYAYLGHKLQAAMPGAILDVNKIISTLIEHPTILFIAIILFSLTELLSGFCLITGLFTRAAAFVSVLLSLSLMIIFGWQGSTCMDEWTMAAATSAIGLTLMLTGGSAYSLDNLIAKKFSKLARRRWFPILTSGPLDNKSLQKFAKIFFVYTLIFSLGTYNYYRGAIVSHYHRGPVDPRIHHLQLSDAKYQNGQISFMAYVASGDMSSPAYIMQATLSNSKGKIVASWSGEQLKKLNPDNIKNVYRYNTIKPSKFGLDGQVGAKATITLPDKIYLDKGEYKLSVENIENTPAYISFNVN